MKNETLHSGAVQSRKAYSKNTLHSKKSKSTEYEQSLVKMKRLLVLIPVAIILVIITALLAGIRQYTAMIAQLPSESKLENFPPSVDYSGKLLLMVSPHLPLPSDYTINLVQIENIQAEKILSDDLTKMVKAAADSGVEIRLKEGYISVEEQNERYLNEVYRLMTEEGYGSSKAGDEAEKRVPRPNHSEEQTGLTVRMDADEYFSESEAYRWLMKNAQQYGFILRYPQEKEKYTDMNPDDTLFRYVGVENAQKMKLFDMCLEEYLSYLDER